MASVATHVSKQLIRRSARTLALLALPGALFSQDPVSFNRDIRPIMSDTCFRCHGPDKSSRMANLRLDLRDEATKPNRRGLTPIVPGDPDKSYIIQRIFATEPARLMPPVSAHKTLTATQKDTIRRWVAEGAKYEGHWAYEPVKRPAAGANGAPPSVDNFIREALAKRGLQPSPEADRATLIRRVSLDLTGIPPTPEEVRTFVAATDPKAYEALVDRLLASPRYAEKQALHWLDAVRYADSAGYHGDNPFPAWPYRDYVLRAFRDNKPFDQFAREQIAGDLLPNPTQDQLTASAYNRVLRVSAEGGLQPKEYLAKYASDRVRTTSSVFLASTLGCAECHDHKFDPFTARDFYSMKAFFADIEETGLVPDRGPKAWGSQVDLATDAQRSERARLQAEIDSLRAALQPRITGGDWEKTVLARHDRGELAWKYQRPIAASSLNGAKLTVYNDEPVAFNFDLGPSLLNEKPPGDGLVVASGPNPENETYSVTLQPGAGVWQQIGVQVIQDESLPGIRVARGADRLMLTEVEAELLPERKKLRFVAAATSIRLQAMDQNPMNAIDGHPNTGWGGSPYNDALHPFLALRLEQPFRTTAQSKLVIRLKHDSTYRRATIGRFRLALNGGQGMPVTDTPNKRDVQVITGLPVQAVEALKKQPAERSEDDRKLLDQVALWTSVESQAQMAALKRAEARKDQFELGVPRVMVTKAVSPPETRILSRGNFLDESGAIVEPAVPAFLGKLNTQGRATRLDLANWIASKDNPLTARAFVNRQWRLLFGVGLSKVLDDFGSQGEWPTHLELLDWLSAEFMDSGWDVKRLVKTMVMSHTYRQSSTPNPGADEKDPDNRLLSRQNRMRVDAETVRDIALSVSGLLVERFGGPSVRPYQPEGYLGALNYPKREYSASRGEDQYRRGIYTFWQRTFLHPSLMTFDAASREECTVNRTPSNTPLQALVLLNDPTFVEAARVFAQTTLQNAKTLDTRVDWAFSRATGRAPSTAERTILLELFKSNQRRFDSHPEDARALVAAGEAPGLPKADPIELASMMTVTRAILNLHETITRN